MDEDRQSSGLRTVATMLDLLKVDLSKRLRWCRFTTFFLGYAVCRRFHISVLPDRRGPNWIRGGLMKLCAAETNFLIVVGICAEKRGRLYHPNDLTLRN